MIGTSLGMMLSLVLLVGGFFDVLHELMPLGLWWAGLVPLLIVVTLAAVTTTRTAYRFSTLVRISAPVSAAVILVRGHVGLAVAVVSIGVICWWGHWLAARRMEGRSLTGIRNDVLYSVSSITRRKSAGT